MSRIMASRFSRKAYSTSSGSEGLIGPAVRNLLIQYGLRPTEIHISGPRGNVLKGDILRQVSEKHLRPVKLETIAQAHATISRSTATTERDIDAGAERLSNRFSFYNPTATAPTPFLDVEVTNMRRTIAKRLVQSKSSIPHAYGTAECSLGKVLSLRKQMINSGLKVSVNDFIIKCTANALGKCPSINIVWKGEQITPVGQIDISVAVATSNGLITPIVPNVAEKDVLEISENVRLLADKARIGKLQPHEFMGGTFTISNLGMFGIHHFSAIINPPQCAILAVGGGQSSIDTKGSLETKINLTLSYDARAISEESIGKFLAHLKHEVENPTETSIGIYSISNRTEVQELFG